MQTPVELAALHLATFSAPAKVYSAPGRVNLIGEHTDYSGGFVMPAAIDFSTLIAISPRTDGRFLAHSINFNEHVNQPIDELLAGRAKSWPDYPAGVLWALREKGVDVSSGFSMTIVGNVPLGAGLSSSASVEVATAFAVRPALPARGERFCRGQRRHHGSVRHLLREAGSCRHDRHALSHLHPRAYSL
jgi:galactokinase